MCPLCLVVLGFKEIKLWVFTEGKRQDVGVSEDLQAVWWLLADGAGGGVVRIVTNSDWFSTRVGMTRKCMGSGSISYCCFQISHSS